MIIFFAVVLIVTFAVNYYIYRHTKPLFSLENRIGLALKILFLFFAIAYPLGRILEQAAPSGISETIAKIGAFWLAAMLYLTILFFVFDITKLVLSLVNHASYNSLKESDTLKMMIPAIIYGVVAIVVFAGYFNALYPKVSQVYIETHKSINNKPLVRIVAASDIHLGSIISNGRLERFVNMVNEQKPDIILLAGDIFDEDLGPIIRNDMGQQLAKLSAPLGVFAVTGNHEYIGGVTAAVEYLENHNITVLRDTFITAGNMLTIVGRDDKQAKTMGGSQRKDLDEIVREINPNLFSVLLDHQPYNLQNAVENGIDLQISGHTHHGQLFPLNFITRSIFEVSKGYKRINDTHIYVSTGFGTWGPPVRVGNRPEIVVFEIAQNQK